MKKLIIISLWVLIGGCADHIHESDKGHSNAFKGTVIDENTTFKASAVWGE